MRAALFESPIAAALLCFALTAQAQLSDSAPENKGPGSICINHVTVIDTETGKESHDQTVMISGARISEVKDSKQVVNGVTGVREMAGPFDANKFRSDLAATKLDTPRFYFASPIVDGYPPRNPDQIVVNNGAEARKVVDEQKKAGADFIKVMDQLSRDEYFAIIEEAKRQNISVVGHVPFAISAGEASASGQKSIEHVHAVPLACSTPGSRVARQVGRY